MTTDRNNTVHYRYRLVEDAPDKEIMIEKTVLRKDSWLSGFNKMLKLDPYLRGTHNPQGFVEFEEYIPATGKVLNGNMLDARREKVQEVREDNLTGMRREELEKLAENFNITPSGKTDEELAKYIMQAQKRKSSTSQRKKERDAVIETEYKKD